MIGLGVADLALSFHRLLLFLTVASSLLDEGLKPGDSLREFYWNNRRHFWWTFSAYLVAVMVKRALLAPTVAAWVAGSWENVVLFGAGVALGFTRRVWAHGLVLAAWYAAVLFEWFGLQVG